MLIRKLSPSEWNEAYPLISQLRDISLEAVFYPRYS